MFEGFWKGTFEFLSNLKANNNKAWFDFNKEDYNKYLLLPFQELATDLGPFMLTIDADFDINPKKLFQEYIETLDFPVINLPIDVICGLLIKEYVKTGRQNLPIFLKHILTFITMEWDFTKSQESQCAS